MNTLDPTLFFEQLCQKTKAAFQNSPVKRKQDEQGQKWSYAICDTPIQRARGIIFGLNWGGRGPHTAQTAMPTGEGVWTYGFLKAAQPYIERDLYVSSDEGVNYSNLCFFRSPKVSDLDEEDWKRSLPLFQEFVEFIDPPWLLMLGTSGFWRLRDAWPLDEIRKHTALQGNRTFKSWSARLDGRPFACVPHPQAHLRLEVRDRLWAMACENLTPPR